jgi:hypothetical protein
MTKIELYQSELRKLNNWDDYLLANSGLPGRRGNIELAQAAALEGERALFERYLEFDPERAPTNSPYEFLAFCGALGLGRLLAEGEYDLLPTIRRYASDPRWRMREAVAMALQQLGRRDMDRLLWEMKIWSRGSFLEQRAAAAGLCEPVLLLEKRHVERVLYILDGITSSIQSADDRGSEAFKVLRKGMGYCWSVAVDAYPEQGKTMMEVWLLSKDRDIRWIMKENLKKKRLERMDANWVQECKGVIS